jgi:NADH-quinone oxidoreductase subunit N
LASLTLTSLVPLLPEIILAGVAVVLLPEGKLVAFGGSFIVDNFARFLKVLAISGSAAAILMSIDYDRRAASKPKVA